MNKRNIVLIKKVEQFVKEAFTKAGKEASIKHFIRTAYWIKHLKTDSDDAMLIAGIAHDIERAFNGGWVKGLTDKGILRKHQEMSAEEISKFLNKEGVDNKFIERVKMLVSRHEEGGNNEQNILKDADCISYFENQALRHVISWQKRGKPKNEIKDKFDYTYKKITSDKARQIVKPLYENAIKQLRSD